MSTTYCQDIIYRTNGDSIACKITKIDNENIYFTLIKNDREITTSLKRIEITEYKTNVVMRKKTELNYKRNLLFISFDPLNLILSGPTVTGELTLQGKNKSVGFGILSGYRNVWLRWMARELLWSDLKASSYTVPIACRIYLKANENTDGVFIGPFTEFGRLRYNSREDELIQAYGLEYGFKSISSSRFTFELTVISSILKYRTPGDWITGFYPAVSVKFGITI